ncbi:MAG: hypothetical protein P8Y07_02200 [Gemmatimonadales bacterium]
MSQDPVTAPLVIDPTLEGIRAHAVVRGREVATVQIDGSSQIVALYGFLELSSLERDVAREPQPIPETFGRELTQSALEIVQRLAE